MMAVHELGHVAGAVMTGGNVERVVLHPLAISRTDVMPNPNPAVVVWLGPVIGCLAPLVAALLIPVRATVARSIAMFFAGFCLIANGAYIGVGSFEGVADAGVILRTGSPVWALMAFGAVATGLGIFIWHRLGSPKKLFADPTVVPNGTGYVLLLALIILVAVEFVLSPR